MGDFSEKKIQSGFPTQSGNTRSGVWTIWDLHQSQHCEQPETKHPLCEYYDENDQSGSDEELLLKQSDEDTTSKNTNWIKLLSVSKFMGIWQSVKNSKYKKIVIYKCYNCGEEFYEVEFLKKHIETTHRKKSDNTPKTVAITKSIRLFCTSKFFSI